MAFTIPKYMNPRIYLKTVTGSVSLHHRLTHAYLVTLNSEEEAVAEIKRLNELTEHEFWEYIIFHTQATIPKEHSHEKDGGKDSAEDWFLSAWSKGTDDFYDKYPKLLVEVDEIPYEIIGEIKRSKYQMETAKAKQIEQEKRQAEAEYQEELKAIQKSKRQIIPAVVEGKIGSKVGMEQALRKKKRLIKKVKYKTKSDMVISIDDSDDLFA